MKTNYKRASFDIELAKKIIKKKYILTDETK